VQEPCYGIRNEWRYEIRVPLLWAPVLVCATLIYSLSAMPRPETYFPFLAWAVNDKTAHAIVYGVLSILCYRALRGASGLWATRHAFVLAILASASYGMTDEWHQYFVPFRTMDAQDLLADVAGSVSALLGWRHMVE
jgi:VanZ family protein